MYVVFLLPTAAAAAHARVICIVACGRRGKGGGATSRVPPSGGAGLAQTVFVPGQRSVPPPPHCRCLLEN